MRKVKDLNEIKRLELGILKHIDSVCKEHGLKYYLVGGTLLGAVRHKGFIPWDDDIDIAMPRADYEILSKVVNSRRYHIHTPKQQGYYYNFSKVVDSQTVAVEAGYRKIEGMGVWVDVFPLDNIKGDYENVKNVFEQLTSVRKRINAYAPRPVLRKNVFGLLKSIFTYNFLNLDKLIEYQQKYIDIAKRSNGEGEYLFLSGGAYGEKEIFKRDIFACEKYMRFEDGEFPIPIGYKDLLEQVYGDYMKLPPVDKRVPIHGIKVFVKE